MWLKIENLSVSYGMIKALNNISFELKQGEIVTLIGANGAGKTTVLNTISGLIKPNQGTIIFNQKNILNFAAHKIAGLGIAHVPEGRKPFPNLSVYENLRLGAYLSNDKDFITQGLSKVFKSFPRLHERIKQPAGTLSGGELQMLAMARGLVSQPNLLMLDEPSMGLSPILVNEIFNIIKDINSSGTSILLVEQNANMALNIASRAYVLETGKITLEGNACDLLNDPRVKSAYLGE
ncbi:MAG: ABC transporter ATP-binding protein [Candidatus Latescibacteria bacterium]|nr:ABC transporter ATP-binding protein [Candidatus Latescibacterota bacterium]